MPTCPVHTCKREVPRAPGTPMSVALLVAHAKPNGEPCEDADRSAYFSEDREFDREWLAMLNQRPPESWWAPEFNVEPDSVFEKPIAVETAKIAAASASAKIDDKLAEHLKKKRAPKKKDAPTPPPAPAPETRAETDEDLDSWQP